MKLVSRQTRRIAPQWMLLPTLNKLAQSTLSLFRSGRFRRHKVRVMHGQLDFSVFPHIQFLAVCNRDESPVFVYRSQSY